MVKHSLQPLTGVIFFKHVHPRKQTNFWAPKWWASEKVGASGFKIWPFLVSMLDFWGVCTKIPGTLTQEKNELRRFWSSHWAIAIWVLRPFRGGAVWTISHQSTINFLHLNIGCQQQCQTTKSAVKKVDPSFCFSILLDCWRRDISCLTETYWDFPAFFELGRLVGRSFRVYMGGTLPYETRSKLATIDDWNRCWSHVSWSSNDFMAHRNSVIAENSLNASSFEFSEGWDLTNVGPTNKFSFCSRVSPKGCYGLRHFFLEEKLHPQNKHRT